MTRKLPLYCHYQAVVWHGEKRSIFYVVAVNLRDETDWCVIKTCNSLKEAEKEAALYEEWEDLGTERDIQRLTEKRV